MFWKLNEKKLPAWASVAKKLILLSPSSAAIERVWSMFSNTFDAGSENSPLMDYIQAVLMLKYNHRSSANDGSVAREDPPD